MKYYIRTGEGRELEVPTGNWLVMLFRQRFLTPDDQIRRADSEKWRRIGDIPEYAAMLRAERDDTATFKKILYGTFLVTLIGVVVFVLLGR